MGKLSPEERRAVAELAKASAKLVRVARARSLRKTHKQLVAEVRALAARLGVDLLNGRDPRTLLIEELRDIVVERACADQGREQEE